MTKTTSELIDRLSTPAESGLDLTVLVPLLRLLADGEPVAIPTLAHASGVTEAALQTRLAAVPDTEYDDQGHIVGQGTLRPTRHRFTVDGQELYTWCALDTLIFPTLINRAARIESHSPPTGDRIHVSVTPDAVTEVSPATAVVSLVNPQDMTSIRSSFCNHVHYFTSAEDAQPWLVEHPDATVLPVAEAYQLGTTLTRRALPSPTSPAAPTCCP